MADAHRPEHEPAVHMDRYSNLSWRKEPSPTRRVPAAPRSRTMDPRSRSLADPKKRVPSRSPEGGHARKQLKQNPPSGPRRTSLPNDLTSNPSTATHTPPPPAPPPPPNGPLLDATKDSALDVDLEGIVKLLIGFQSHVAEFAALQIAHDQAKVRYERAQLEFNEGRKQFDVFPAIKERKTAEKAAAQEELQAVEIELGKQVNPQAEAITNVAKLIRQATAQRTDVVSRAEFESSVAARDALQSSFKSLQDEVRALRKVAENANTASDKIPALRENVDNIREGMKTVVENGKLMANKTTEVENKLAVFINGDVKKLVSKDEITGISEKYEVLANNLATVEAKQKDLVIDVSQLKAYRIASDLVKSKNQMSEQSQKEATDLLKADMLAIKQDVDSKHGSLSGEIRSLESRQDEMQRSMTDLLKADILAIKQDVDSKHGTLSGEIRSLKTQHDAMQRSFTPLLASVPGAGDQTLAKRIEKLEKDLAQTKSEDGSRDRHQSVDGRSLFVDPVSTGEDNSKDEPLPSIDSSRLTAINERLQNVEDDMRAMEHEAAEKDKILELYIKDELAPISERLTTHEANHAQMQNTLNTNTEGLQRIETRINAAEQSLSEKVSLSNFKGFIKNTQDSFNTVESEQRDQDRLIHQLRPQTNNGTPIVPSMQQGAPLPNGVGGSPGINGVHRSHNSSLSNGSVHQPPMHYDAEVNALKARVDATIHVNRHLQQRVDNLTTKEVVRAMCDQMNIIYPNAKHFHAFMNSSTQRNQQFLGQIGKLQEDKARMDKKIESIQSDLKDSSTIANTAAGEAWEAARKAQQSVEDLRSEVDTIKSDIDTLATTVKNTPAPSNDANEALKQIKALRERLDEVSTMATAADRLSRQHSSHLDKLDLEALATKLTDNSERIAQHDDWVEKGQRGFEDVNERIKQLNHRLVEHDGEIMGLDEIVAQIQEGNQADAEAARKDAGR